jgi:uncharacterized repeat protein (TIGR01451 family)
MVHAGRPVTITITVQNLGPNTSHGVTLNDAVPAGMTILGASGNWTLIGNALFFAVPDLPAGGSASFTVTVIPTAPGQFTDVALASTHDDPNPVNNKATMHITVLPPPFPRAGSADVTAFVQLVPLGSRRPQRHLVYRLKNVGAVPLQGPLRVVVVGLPRGVKLLNAGGRTRGGQPFVLVNAGGENIFDPGDSAIVQLVFSQPLSPRRLHLLVRAFAS